MKLILPQMNICSVTKLCMFSKLSNYNEKNILQVFILENFFVSMTLLIC